MKKQNVLPSGFQQVYYIVPDKIYKTIDLPEYKVFAYEL
jgi:putative ABC transport system permease protein